MSETSIQDLPSPPGEDGAGVTRLTQRGLARGEQLLAQATALFLQHGYSGVSVDEIVKAVGGSKTNVYRQFGGKEGLFMAVIQALCSDFLQGFRQLQVLEMPLAAGLRLLGLTLVQQLVAERHVAFQRLVIAESGRFPALSQTWFVAGPQQTRLFVARFLAVRQGLDAAQAGQCLQAATLFHDMLVFNPVHLALLGQGPDTPALERHVEAVVQLFVSGWRPAAEVLQPPSSTSQGTP